LETKEARIKEHTDTIMGKPLIKKELVEKKEYDNLAVLIQNEQKAKKEWVKKQKEDKAIFDQKQEKKDAILTKVKNH
jgi:septum formation inhibitor-activating ATPase MinD